MKTAMEEKNQIIIYQTEDGLTSVDVKMDGETVWLSQQQMAELFEKDRTVIGRHIRNIYKEGELVEFLTCAKNAQVKNYGRRQGFTQDVVTILCRRRTPSSVG